MPTAARTMAVLLGCLTASPALAEPLVEAESRTLFLPQPVARRGELGAWQDETAATLLELERVSARGLGEGAFLRGLTLHQSGWLLVDPAYETRARPVAGQLRSLYVEYADRDVQARLGRHLVTGGVTGVAFIDGASARWLGPGGLEVSAHGGLLPLPYLTASPYYARLGDRIGEHLEPGPWRPRRTRRGFALVGGRIGESLAGWGSAGVSFVHEQEAGQLGRQLLGADLAFDRYERLAVLVNLGYDVAGRGLATARATVEVELAPGLRAEVAHRREDPTLLLPKTSIFSTFASTAYGDTGARLAYRTGPLVLDGGAAWLRYQEGEDGLRASASATLAVGQRRPVRARLAYERLSGLDLGQHAVTADVTASGLGPLRASAEVWALRFDEPVEGVSYSVTPQASVGVTVLGVDLDTALGFHTGPVVEAGLFGMLKARALLGLAPERRSLAAVQADRDRAEGDRLVFSHKQHLDFDLKCTDCHPDAQLAPGGAVAMPTHKTCIGECHADGLDKDGCKTCHTRPDRPLRAPRGSAHDLAFSHRRHAARTDCAACHAPAPASTRAEDVLRPDMAACLACHVHRVEFAAPRCDGCHRRWPHDQGRPAAVSAFSHAGDFRRKHQDAARSKGAACLSCHDVTFCADCHEREAPAVPAALFQERPDRARFHRGSFLDRHGIEARTESASCLRCHGRTSCDECHLERGVSAAARNALSPHPPGWVRAGAGAGRSGHAAAARRGVVDCMACHDQAEASGCVRCHASGSGLPSPHPAGFTSSLGKGEARVCLTCHRG